MSFFGRPSLVNKYNNYEGKIGGGGRKPHAVHKALRICMGVFRPSPVDSLYAENGEAPLSLH